MPKQEKNPKLNRQAKSLFIRHTPYNIKKDPKANDYLKFPKISKESLFVANSQKIYSLHLLSFSYEEYSVELEIDNELSNGKHCAYFDCNFEQLKKLSKLIHINFINMRFFPGNADEQIAAFRRVWNEIYPDTKINFYFHEDFDQFQSVLSLIEELSGRLHNFEYRVEALIRTDVKLDLNECVLSTKMGIVEFKELLQKEHKIKKLKFILEREDCSSDSWWKKPIPIQQHLKNLPANFTLKELEIVYNLCEFNEKVFDPSEFEALLSVFPNLASIRLNIYYYKEKHWSELPMSLEEVKESSEIALDQIQGLRLMLAQKMPMIKLEISYDFDIHSELDGFEIFDEWAESIFDHPELSEAPTHIRPAFNSRKHFKFKIADGDHFESVEDEYHVVSFKWKYNNFVGTFHMHITDNYKSESEREEEEWRREYY